MVKDKKSEEFLGESKKRILAVSTRIKELLKKLTEMDKGSWLKRRAHGQQSLTSSATACSSRFWAVKKKKQDCRPAYYLTTVWYGQLLPAKYVFT